MLWHLQANSNKTTLFMKVIHLSTGTAREFAKAWFQYDRNDRNDRSRNDRKSDFHMIVTIARVVSIWS